MAAGDLGAARDAYTESLNTRRRLAAADPGNAQAARDLSISLNNIGQVAMAAGDLGAARDAYTESLNISRRLAAADPGNAQAARDLMVSLVRLAELAAQESKPDSPAALRAWREVVVIIDRMDKQGWITAPDRQFAAQFRTKAAVPTRTSQPTPTATSTPSWLPIGASPGTPLHIRTAITTWLDAETWAESYAHLTAHRTDLTSPQARTELAAQADDDDRPIHLAILDLFTAGMPADELERITTEPQTALDFIVQTLTDRQTELATRALNACPQLAGAPQGHAIDLAVKLIAQTPTLAQKTARAFAATPQAELIAAEFGPIAEALSEVLNPSEVTAIQTILTTD
jgi:tetratricopeptide (TPR) repeat protein